MSINVADGSVGQSIHTIARKFDGVIVVVVKDGVLGIGGELKDVGSKPVFITASIGFGDGPFVKGNFPQHGFAC